uniref:Uncharacterized protein n=1 Tax=Terrapene triunguis TaxID=2587831 RepID=A0A674KE05_9SAUR
HSRLEGGVEGGGGVSVGREWGDLNQSWGGAGIGVGQELWGLTYWGRTAHALTLSTQGSPFSDPGFSALGLRWAGVPVATFPFLAWRTMGDSERLARNYGAYATFDAFLQLVWDDQDELCPNCSELLAMLGTARARTRGLLANLTSIMAAMGIPTPPATDPLTSEAAGVGAFEKKCRGYVVCREYHGWVDRTVPGHALPVGWAMDFL